MFESFPTAGAAYLQGYWRLVHYCYHLKHSHHRLHHHKMGRYSCRFTLQYFPLCELTVIGCPKAWPLSDILSSCSFCCVSCDPVVGKLGSVDVAGIDCFGAQGCSTAVNAMPTPSSVCVWFRYLTSLTSYDRPNSLLVHGQTTRGGEIISTTVVALVGSTRHDGASIYCVQ
jgi:hypothetical protein